jgi:hypothetical protein
MVLLYWTLVLANAAAFGTLAVGWWAVPIVALVGAAFSPRGAKPIISVPLGCALGWTVLLLRSARAETFPTLVDAVGRVVPTSGRWLLVATVGLGLVLALGAALLGAALRWIKPPS